MSSILSSTMSSFSTAFNPSAIWITVIHPNSTFTGDPICHPSFFHMRRRIPKVTFLKKGYDQLIRCLLILSNQIWPDVAYTAFHLACFMHAPGPRLWKVGKHVSRYLSGIKRFRLTYLRNGKVQRISGFSYSNWAQGKPERKSVSGYVFTCIWGFY